MARYKVYISDFDYPDNEIEKRVLEPIGAEVIGLQCRTGEGLADMARDADVILQQYANIPRATIKELQRCKAICRYGIGVDIVDVQAAYEHGMVVTNVPDYALDEVADHTITLSLMLLRRIPWYERATRSGQWHWSASAGPVKRLRDCTWGMIGFGRIAQNVVRKVKAFNCRIIAFDPFVSKGYMKTFGTERVDLETLLQEASIVNVLCPHTPATEHIIDEHALRMMRPDSVLVNCARGKLVDNRALHQALRDGWIASAGLDDTEEEPAKLDHWEPAMNPLFELDNCFVTPHVAYVSEGSLSECRQIAAENAKAVLLGETPPNLVRP